MATSSVSISSSSLAILRSLQSTTAQFDKTNLNLSTGKDVNSVFDDPINYIASQSLSNQASDLSRLLDGIALSLKTIEQANNGATALESLLDNAQAIIDSASEELSSTNRAASITSTKDLRAYEDLTDIQGIDNGDQLKIVITDPENTGSDLDGSDAANGLITIATNDSLEDLVAKINSSNDSQAEDVVTASITAQGGLKIEAASGRQLRVELIGDATTTTTAGEFALANALGFTDVFAEEAVPGGANFTAAATVSAGATIDSGALTVNATGAVAGRTDTLASLTGFTANAPDNAGDTLTLHVDTGDSAIVDANAAFVLNGATVEGLVDYVNTDSKLKTLVSASYNETTGKISIRALSEDVKGIVVDVDSLTNALDLNFGFGTGVTDASIATANDGSEYVRFGASAGAVLALEEQYNTLLSQIDSLVADAGFQGVNLLSGDTLTTYFTANRSSKLETEGTNFSSAQLGLSTANFVSQDAITAFTNERLDATEAVRAFGKSLANDLNTIQTRKTFAESSIDTLEGAATQLTEADPNEESAKMLALQIRQQLSTIALSLASQAQQSVLRLF